MNTTPMQTKEEFPPFKNLSDTSIPRKVNKQIVKGEVTMIILVIPKRYLPTYKCPTPQGRKSSKRNAAH